MESNNRTNLIIGVVAGLVLGLLLGMLLFWVLFPVEWTDAHSYDLSPIGKAEYVALVADSFSLDKDATRAAQYLDYWEPAEKEQAVADAIAIYEAEGRTDKVLVVQDFAMAVGIPLPDETAPLPETVPQTSFFERVRIPCLVFFGVLLVLVVGWIGYRVLTKQRAEAEPVQPSVQPVTVVAPPAEDWEGVGQPPLGHWFTTYELGEDTYDESFSIETPLGEFLGECGVGISEMIGVGDPAKVTAFEVWLFDKSDIRTVTKVLMSEHAYQDEELRARLASKGEAVLVEPGSPFVLETSGLQVRVDVTELVYGDDEMPAGSFFSKLTVELVATTKPAGGGQGTA
jgi:hypothetical protein